MLPSESTACVRLKATLLAMAQIVTLTAATLSTLPRADTHGYKPGGLLARRDALPEPTSGYPSELLTGLSAPIHTQAASKSATRTRHRRSKPECEEDDSCEADEYKVNEDTKKSKVKRKNKGKGKRKGKVKTNTVYETVDVPEQTIEAEAGDDLSNAISVCGKGSGTTRVRIRVYESLQDDNRRNLDVLQCGSNAWENNYIQWHSEKVAASIEPGAVIKCQTFTLEALPNQSDEDGKNMAIIHVFDKNSKLVLDNSWQENRDVPILVKSEDPTILKQSGQHYEFKCENYSFKREDTGRYMLGDRCQIISRGNGNTLRCLEAQGWGDAAEKGDVALAKCDTEIATQFWSVESVDYEFAADAKLEEATIDTDIKDIPGPPTSFQPGAEDVCV